MLRPLVWTLFCLLAGVTTAAQAPAVTPIALLAKPTADHLSLSPDGSRLAVVADTGEGQHSLAIFQINGVALKPIMKTAIPGLVAVTRYEWISNDIMLIWVDIGAGNPPVWAMLNIAERVYAPMQHPFSSLVRKNWNGNPDHVLILTRCTVDQLCLFDWDIRTNTGLGYGTGLPDNITRVEANERGDVIAIGRGSDGSEKRLSWSPTKHDWLLAPAAADRSTDSEGDLSLLGGFKEAQERFQALLAGSTDRTTWGPVYTTSTHRVIGISRAAPGPPFEALLPALKDVALEVAEAFPGKRVYWTSVSDTVNHAVLMAQAAGEPAVYYLWSAADSRVVPLMSSRPLDPAQLAHTRIEEHWFDDDTPVSVISPPASIGTRRALLELNTTAGSQARENMIRFDPYAQVLAQQGVLTVNVPIGAPALEGLTGEAWRRAVGERLVAAANRIVHEGLVGSDKLCVGGTLQGGYAALAAAAASPNRFACVIAIDVPFQPEALVGPSYSQTTSLQSTFSYTWYFSSAALKTWSRISDGAGADLANGHPAAWAALLPAKVFVAYIRTGADYGSALQSQAGGFEAAMKNAGKSAQVYAPTTDFGDQAKWFSAMDLAIAKFMPN